MIRNTKLTTNHESQITANHIAAFFKILVQVFTLPSSQAAVSIWNHHHKQRTSATNDSIQSIQFIAVWIVFNIFDQLLVSTVFVLIVFTQLTFFFVFFQNHSLPASYQSVVAHGCGSGGGVVHAANTCIPANMLIVAINIVIIFFIIYYVIILCL